MALKTLSTGEMIQISAPWIDKKSPAGALLAGIVETAAFLPKLAETHASLLETQRPIGDAALTAIAGEAAALDQTHDRFARGIHIVLTGLASLASGARAVELLALRDTVFPDGMEIIQKSYREEAGNTELLDARLQPADRQLLAALPLPKDLGGSLSGAVAEWTSTARKLGATEDRRAAALSEQGLATSGTDVVRARNQWIRVVNALRALLELAQIDAAAEGAILGPLRLVEKQTERRTTAPAETPIVPAPKDAIG